MTSYLWYWKMKNRKNSRKSSTLPTIAPLETHELSNGIRILHRQVPYTPVVHCGIIADVGSRDELPNEQGMAHFIEHMIFKGTQKRKTFHILNYLESVGGDLNAYTTKEKTCIYASITRDHLGRALELLCDICFNSTFPEKEIEKEKQVISEEIDMYQDSPEEIISEWFEENLMGGHSLAHSISGTKEGIQAFDREALLQFRDRQYSSDRLVIGTVGNVSLARVIKLVEKYAGGVPQSQAPKRNPQSFRASNFQLERRLPVQQTHVLMGGEAYNLPDKQYVPFYILNNLLGGPAMNSQLNLNIREKYGLTYNIYSFYAAYMTAGNWGVYYACEDGAADRIRTLVHKEIKKLCETKLGTLSLNKAKRQVIGQLTLGQESLLSRMLATSRNMLDFGRDFPLPEIVEEIEAVTASDLIECANRWMNIQNLSEIKIIGE